MQTLDWTVIYGYIAVHHWLNQWTSIKAKRCFFKSLSLTRFCCCCFHNSFIPHSYSRSGWSGSTGGCWTNQMFVTCFISCFLLNSILKCHWVRYWTPACLLIKSCVYWLDGIIGQYVWILLCAYIWPSDHWLYYITTWKEPFSSDSLFWVWVVLTWLYWLLQSVIIKCWTCTADECRHSGTAASGSQTGERLWALFVYKWPDCSCFYCSLDYRDCWLLSQFGTAHGGSESWLAWRKQKHVITCCSKQESISDP